MKVPEQVLQAEWGSGLSGHQPLTFYSARSWPLTSPCPLLCHCTIYVTGNTVAALKCVLWGKREHDASGI